MPRRCRALRPSLSPRLVKGRSALSIPRLYPRTEAGAAGASDNHMNRRRLITGAAIFSSLVALVISLLAYAYTWAAPPPSGPRGGEMAAVQRILTRMDEPPLGRMEQ